MVALIFALVGALQNTLALFLTAAFVLLLGIENRIFLFTATSIVLDIILGAFMLGGLTASLVAGRWWGVITGLLMAVVTLLLTSGQVATYTTIAPGGILLIAAIVGAVGGLLLFLALRVYNARMEREE
ncbi:MAG: hypothetical protein GX552_04755 [Chloroflexi bacterium]|nr:hypothetical protein [Chloroflexota bacterium]